MHLEPLISRKWDGSNLWVQWTEVSDAGYRMQIRLRRGAGEWEEWRDVGGVDPLRRGWLVVPHSGEGRSCKLVWAFPSAELQSTFARKLLSLRRFDVLADSCAFRDRFGRLRKANDATS